MCSRCPGSSLPAIKIRKGIIVSYPLATGIQKRFLKNEDESLTDSNEWFEGFEGKRVRVIIEELE